MFIFYLLDLHDPIWSILSVLNKYSCFYFQYCFAGIHNIVAGGGRYSKYSQQHVCKLQWLLFLRVNLHKELSVVGRWEQVVLRQYAPPGCNHSFCLGTTPFSLSDIFIFCSVTWHYMIAFEYKARRSIFNIKKILKFNNQFFYDGISSITTKHNLFISVLNTHTVWVLTILRKLNHSPVFVKSRRSATTSFTNYLKSQDHTSSLSLGGRYL